MENSVPSQEFYTDKYWQWKKISTILYTIFISDFSSLYKNRHQWENDQRWKTCFFLSFFFLFFYFISFLFLIFFFNFFSVFLFLFFPLISFLFFLTFLDFIFLSQFSDFCPLFFFFLFFLFYFFFFFLKHPLMDSSLLIHFISYINQFPVSVCLVFMFSVSLGIHRVQSSDLPYRPADWCRQKIQVEAE